MSEAIIESNQVISNKLSTKTNPSDMDNIKISQASTQLDGSHQSNEISKDLNDTSNELIGRGAAKDKKKKKKK